MKNNTKGKVREADFEPTDNKKNTHETISHLIFFSPLRKKKIEAKAKKKHRRVFIWIIQAVVITAVG